jgi:hypothetical protein
VVVKGLVFVWNSHPVDILIMEFGTSSFVINITSEIIFIENSSAINTASKQKLDLAKCSIIDPYVVQIITNAEMGREPSALADE